MFISSCRFKCRWSPSPCLDERESKWNVKKENSVSLSGNVLKALLNNVKSYCCCCCCCCIEKNRLWKSDIGKKTSSYFYIWLNNCMIEKHLWQTESHLFQVQDLQKQQENVLQLNSKYFSKKVSYFVGLKCIEFIFLFSLLSINNLPKLLHLKSSVTCNHTDSLSMYPSTSMWQVYR